MDVFNETLSFLETVPFWVLLRKGNEISLSFLFQEHGERIESNSDYNPWEVEQVLCSGDKEW